MDVGSFGEHFYQCYSFIRVAYSTCITFHILLLHQIGSVSIQYYR